MEGRGSGVEDWRGEAHLGLSLPVSAHRCACPLIVSHVHALWPVSVRHCPCPCIVARVPVSLPMSVCRCPCLCVVARSLRVVPHVRSRLWAVVFVHGCGW